MKKILLLLLFPLFLFGKEVLISDLDFDFDTKTYTTKAGKKFTGTFVIKTSEGVVVRSAEVKNGRLDGVETTYQDGKTASKITYKNGVKDGDQHIFNLSTGKLSAVHTMKNDKKEGLSKTFYDDGKTVRIESIYKNDKRDGIYKMYYPNGKLQMEGVYKGFKKVGKWKWFDQKGNVTRTQEYK